MAWVEGRVIERIEWTPTLFSLRVAAELAPYKAGQFTKLALEQGDRRIQRAYSFVNPPLRHITSSIWSRSRAVS